MAQLLSSIQAHKTHPTIGVFALQGCVTPHKFHLESLGAEYKEVRSAEELKCIDGLILPGGESTTMLKLIDAFDLKEALENTFMSMPVWGICAGSILMAKKVIAPEQNSYGLLDITIRRNAYGNQLNSFNAVIENSSVSFIRAPQIESVGTITEVKAVYNNIPVWVKENFYMATTFHPELDSSIPSSMHREFLEMVSTYKLSIHL